MEQEQEQRPDKLFYYSKSKDVEPGKGINEYINDPSKYEILSKIKDWRKILSNFYVSPFTWNGKTWNSVEHAFQGSKIALADPEKGEWFALESGHKIGQADGFEARKNRKLVLLGPNELKEWNRIKSGIMESILYEKYIQVPLAGRVMIETDVAELWHSPGRANPERQLEMENVREKLMMDTDIRILSKILRATKNL